MNSPYEDPAKTELRVAAEIALDQAGFALAERVRVALPQSTSLQGTLFGDLQTIGRDGERTHYYIRPGQDDAIPKWIANLARASHAEALGPVYLVVRFVNNALTESAVENGVGLLRLTEDGIFETVVDYKRTIPRSLEDSVRDKITAVRRELERQVENTQQDIDARRGRSAEIISGMDDGVADQYRDRFDSEYRNLESWGDQMSKRLDALGSRASVADITAVQTLVTAGPPLIEGGAR